MKRAWFATLPTLGIALWSACAAPQVQRQGFRPAAGPTPVPAQTARLSIQHYEYARQDGAGFLQYQLAKGQANIREQAATALGRLPYPEFGQRVSGPLSAALQDKEARVREAAAFALGMRADPATVQALCAFAPAETVASVRARRVEAASRIDADAARVYVFSALQDRELEVRAEAVLGMSRWKRDVAAWSAAEAHLVGLALEHTTPVELQWRALFALARQKSAMAGEAYLQGAKSKDVRARTYAAQGLAIVQTPASCTALQALLKDADERVVCESVLALGKHASPAALEALLSMGSHASAHVRRLRLEALAAFPKDTERILPLLEASRTDPALTVRAAGIETGAKLRGDRALHDLEALARAPEARLRLAVAIGCAALPTTARVELALSLCADPDFRVAAAAHEALVGIADERARAALGQLMSSGDNGVRLAVTTFLETQAQPADVDGLRAAFRSAQGDIAPELKRSILKAYAKIDNEASKQELRAALADGDPTVRRLAAKLCGQELLLPLRQAEADRDWSALAELPRRIEVEIRTTRGNMRFELFPEETPLHVHNFLQLARRGEYSGTLFHRVVPDFVIQGGDYRGDGNGGRTFDGGLLLAEFTPRKFVRGSLGMPRNDEVDSGGSQIFVTHRETPHLDGRYTLFGQLIAGDEVLSAIEVEDRILEVRIL